MAASVYCPIGVIRLPRDQLYSRPAGVVGNAGQDGLVQEGPQPTIRWCFSISSLPWKGSGGPHLAYRPGYKRWEPSWPRLQIVWATWPARWAAVYHRNCKIFVDGLATFRKFDRKPHNPCTHLQLRGLVKNCLLVAVSSHRPSAFPFATDRIASRAEAGVSPGRG
jgi:hypothetical protein